MEGATNDAVVFRVTAYHHVALVVASRMVGLRRIISSFLTSNSTASFPQVWQCLPSWQRRPPFLGARALLLLQVGKLGSINRPTTPIDNFAEVRVF
jgi:hypothetical protein